MNDICKKRATKAFRYFCENLKIDCSEVVLRFVDSSDLNDNDGVENVYGDTETMACMEMPSGRRKRYYVSINNRDGVSGDMVVESVAHELVHVKQHRDGRLKTFGKNDADMTYEFDGVKYDTFANHVDYFTAPWEIEARVDSRKMVYEFNRYMRDNASHRVVKKLN